MGHVDRDEARPGPSARHSRYASSPRPKSRHWVARGVARLALASLLLVASSAASAQSGLEAVARPSRVGVAPGEPPVDVLFGIAVPPAPAGFEQVRDESVVWQFPGGARGVVDALREATRAELARVTSELGAAEQEVIVRVARDPREMAACAPPEAPPPGYAVGVAYPRLSLIVLTLAAPTTWERPAVDRVLVHEWSHLSLHRALGGRRVPRWFDEGLAIHQARERSLARVRPLWEATVHGTLVPLDSLSAEFPARPHAVDLAYAQSTDFVDWLFERGRTESVAIDALLRRIADGEEFEDAILLTYGAGMAQLEDEWQADLRRRYTAVPLILGSSLGWGLVLALLVLAYRRRRIDQARTLARWEDDETREEAARVARSYTQAHALASARDTAA